MQRVSKVAIALTIFCVSITTVNAQHRETELLRTCRRQVARQDCKVDIDLVRPEMPGQLVLLSGVGVVVRIFNTRPLEHCTLSHVRPPDVPPTDGDAIGTVIGAVRQSVPLSGSESNSVVGLAEVGKSDTVGMLASELVALLGRAREILSTRFVSLGASTRTVGIDGTRIVDRFQYDKTRSEFINVSREVLKRWQALQLDPKRPPDAALQRGGSLLAGIVDSLDQVKDFDQSLYIPANNDIPSSSHKTADSRYLVCRDSLTGTSTLSERIDVAWRNPQNVSLSAGILISSVAGTDFKTQATAQDQVTIVADKTLPRVMPVFLVNFKLWNKTWRGRSVNVGISPGLGLNLNGSEVRTDFLTGVTLNIAHSVLTLGPHFARVPELSRGLALNTPVNLKVGTKPATVDAWKVGIGLAFSYKLPVRF